jgi:transposase
MAAALSLDLRERVISAIEAGVSCRRAAERFGVGAASAIRWYARFRQDGRIGPKPMGGDRYSHRMEAHSELILGTCEARPQIYLRELRDALEERGVQTSLSGLSRFFARHGITRKKGQSTRANRTART